MNRWYECWVSFEIGFHLLLFCCCWLIEFHSTNKNHLSTVRIVIARLICNDKNHTSMGKETENMPHSPFSTFTYTSNTHTQSYSQNPTISNANCCEWQQKIFFSMWTLFVTSTMKWTWYTHYAYIHIYKYHSHKT